MFRNNPNRMTERRTHFQNRRDRNFATSDDGWTRDHDSARCLLCILSGEGVVKSRVRRPTVNRELESCAEKARLLGTELSDGSYRAKCDGFYSSASTLLHHAEHCSTCRPLLVKIRDEETGSGD